MGEKFDLTKFSGNDDYILIEKKNRGTSLTTLERPGLWNGAMEKWNTIFVEIDHLLYNPVKTVNDLLNNGHQS